MTTSNSNRKWKFGGGINHIRIYSKEGYPDVFRNFDMLGDNCYMEGTFDQSHTEYYPTVGDARRAFDKFGHLAKYCTDKEHQKRKNSNE